MRILQRPEAWLPPALIGLAVGGAGLLLLACQATLPQDELTHLGRQIHWRCTFDALSASCGVGLLTFEGDVYGTAGRWVLVGVGTAGAVLFLIATRQVAGRLCIGAGRSLPSYGRILAVYAGLQALVVPAVWLAQRTDGAAGWGPAVWTALATFGSLGWTHAAPGPATRWVLAAVSFLSALGWGVWLWWWPARGFARHWRLGLCVVSYALFLLVCAGLITAFERPRETAGHQGAEAPAPQGTAADRIAQVACAAGAGLGTTPLEDRAASEGTKIVLAGVVLVGGLGGSVGGGVKWLLVLWAVPGLRRLVHGSAWSQGCQRAAVWCTASLGALTVIVTLGLLLIENATASGYQRAPTAADALVDAASAVSGANLTTGVVGQVTSPRLSRGIRQSVDAYQYGMAWLILAMIIGRCLPIAVLAYCAGSGGRSIEPAAPPLC